MSGDDKVTGHYGRGKLLERLEAALAEDGADSARPSLEALAPYDHFHGRGLEATSEIADTLEVAPHHHLLDIGSGIGGPARWMHHRFGCRVTGIDLTAEFCDVARHLSGRVGMGDALRFEHGDALAMPFAEASFDGAYSMNVSMNIADKGAFYREIRRVLKAGAWLVLSEIARGSGPEIDYPVPWAASAEASFLSTPEETRRGLESAGFEVLRFRTTEKEALEFGARSREIVARGGKPPHRAVILIHAEGARAAMANTSRGVSEGRIVPIEILSRRRP